MKSKFLFFLLFLLSSFLSFSQPKIESQSEKKHVLSYQTHVKNMFTLSNGNNIITRTGDNRGELVIEKFDKDLNIMLSIPLPMDKEHKYLYYNYVVKLKDELYAISTFENSKNLTSYYYAQHINSETLKVDQDRILFKEYKRPYDNGWLQDELKYSYNSDSTKILFYLTNIDQNISSIYLPKKKEQTNKFVSFNVFDTQFNELYNVNKELDLPEHMAHVIESKFVGDKTCVLTKKYITRTRGELNEKANFKYHLLIFNNQGEIIKEQEISKPNTFIRDLRLPTDESNSIVCAGYFFDKGVKAIQGTYYLRVWGDEFDKNKESLSRYSEDYLYQRMNEKEVKHYKKSFQSLGWVGVRKNNTLSIKGGKTLIDTIRSLP